MDVSVVGGAYESNSKAISAQEAVNCYVELGPAPALVGVHGDTVAVDLGARVVGLHNAWGVLYAVAGKTVYRINQDHTATSLGSLSDYTAAASMTHNIIEMLIVAGGLGHVVQRSTDVLSKITDADFPVTDKADFLDGYGILLERDSGRFHFTSTDDFETIDGADFATAEGSPDDLVSLIVDHRELWLFGTRTTEIWSNVGDATNPIQRREGAFIERGCRGANSPAKLDNTVFWLGDNNVVFRADGITPIRVSNHGIENLISGTTTDPVGFAYTWDGHAFYQLNFPGELSIVYDASIPDPTNAWHVRRTGTGDDSVYRHYAFCYGNHYAAGEDGKVYQLQENTYTHAGLELRRIRSIGPIRTDGYQTMSELVLVFETGENSDPVNASEVFIEISDDSGRTFGGRIRSSVGTQGDYRTEVKFLGLGGFYDNQRVIRITMTDNARFALVRATVET